MAFIFATLRTFLYTLSTLKLQLEICIDEIFADVVFNIKNKNGIVTFPLSQFIVTAR